jgi:uncharacterized membrane protein
MTSMKEHRKRSLAKGITWRVLASLDTLALSFLFTQNIINTFKIGTGELVSKLFLYYIHERVWLKSDFWRKEVTLGSSIYGIDRRRRSFAKGLSWRIIGSLDTLFWAALITRSVTLTLGISLTEILTKFPLYYFHERGWNHIKWGNDKIKNKLL